MRVEIYSSLTLAEFGIVIEAKLRIAHHDLRESDRNIDRRQRDRWERRPRSNVRAHTQLVKGVSSRT